MKPDVLRCGLKIRALALKDNFPFVFKAQAGQMKLLLLEKSTALPTRSNTSGVKLDGSEG